MLVDEALEESMAFAQKASSMVLALRKKVGINVRKPLAKVLVPVLDDEVRSHIEKVKDIFLTEVNVKEIEFLHDTTGIITKKIKPNFKTLGKIYGKQMKEIAAAFATLGQDVIARIEGSEEYVLDLPSGPVALHPGDYEISSDDMPGWLVATEGSLTVALDIVQTPELVLEGAARELVLEGAARELIHPIQNLRKESGFDLTDRISTEVYADGPAHELISKALEAFGEYVSNQTLSTSLVLKPLAEAPADSAEVAWEEGVIKIKLNRNTNMAEETKTRYSDEELAEFKAIIDEMLSKARAEYDTLRQVIMHNGSNDIEDTSPSFKTVEDDGANQLSKEEASQLAQRQYKFIQNLEAALVRIENKTYGICRETGKLIPKERLRLVPHATLTVEAKEKLAKAGRK